jgi:DnaJ-class molecular chaperone
VLSDADKRKKYDRYGERWEQAEAFEKAGRAGGPGGGWFSQTIDLSDLFGRGAGGGPFEGIFEAFTGRRGPMRGQNVEFAAEITLEEAFQGATRLIEMQSEEACATCGGSGQIAGAVCHVCQGAGQALKMKRLEVKIPAGVQDGARVRVAGEGRAGFGGGPRGDLYVVVRVRSHSRFERRGADLVTEAGVLLEDAVLGGEVQVRTLNGKHIALKLPPLTQNGRVFRLGGLGMPRLSPEAARRGEEAKGKAKARGDLLVRVRVVLPESLTDRERALFEQLREERRKGKAEAA